MPRRIAHLDMDAFYASVELLRYPQLRDQPVVIGGSRQRLRAGNGVPDHEIPVAAFPRLRGYAGRGVITTANYAARRFGVGSAMGLMKAAQLCPDAVLLPMDFEEYRRCSRAFKAVVTEIAPVMEDRGVDEVYIDFTDVPGGQREGGRVLARLLQRSVFDSTGLTCSIGVAPNKLLAKMASEFDKPNGITVLQTNELASRIWPLPCRKINGVGPKTDARLQALGLRTIGELAACERDWLIGHFGQAYGAWLWEAAHGQDERPVVTESEPVSMSRETTFERNLHPRRDRVELGRLFTGLCEQVAADLQRKGYRGKTIGVKLKFEDFSQCTRDHTVPLPIDDASGIRRAAGLALKRAPLERPLRLLGVRVGQLSRADAANGSGPADSPSDIEPSLF